jgi:hypothetical protein
MFLEIEAPERDLLLDLLEARIRELGPEIRRTATLDYRERLKTDLHRLEHRLHRFHEADWDVNG